ncbi:hypothetical protein CERSUDRAFT_114221 [Gelatoporia subvermispora B]|uniref:Uncharacterized protein n=1 Tax=Ceriporiopsis subvermispora (strain B) TaxID=914234 RepID=M2QZF7_CERS8|nr:hypothetical protein CERSUDRAFT_114221 [Gelatoporia subvermispora B]
MAAFNVSLDDSSSSISYTPSNAWVDTSLNDSSLHSADVQGASASITFNGTGVWFYGSNRPTYGSYQLAVDNEVIASGSAASSSALVDQLLGGASGLTMGQHTAVLTSNGDGTIDLDSLVFETQDATSSDDAVDASASAPVDIEAAPSSVATPTVVSFFSIVPTLGAPSLIVTTLPIATPTTTPNVEVDAVSASASPDAFSTEVFSFFSIVPSQGFPTLVYETTVVPVPSGSVESVASSIPTANPSAIAVDAVSASATAVPVSTEVISFFSIVPTAGVPSLIVETTTVALPTTSGVAAPSASSGATSDTTSGGAAANNMSVDSPASAEQDNAAQSSPSPSATSTSTSKSNISTGVLAAIIAGGVVAVILLILLGYYLVLRFRRRLEKVRRDRAQMESPVLPIQDPLKADLEKGVWAGKRISSASQWSQSSGSSGRTLAGTLAGAPAKWDMPPPPAVGAKWELPLPAAGSPFGRAVESRLAGAEDDQPALEQVWLSPPPPLGLQDRPFTPTRPPRPPGLDLNLPKSLV